MNLERRPLILREEAVESCTASRPRAAINSNDLKTAENPGSQPNIQSYSIQFLGFSDDAHHLPQLWGGAHQRSTPPLCSPAEPAGGSATGARGARGTCRGRNGAWRTAAGTSTCARRCDGPVTVCLGGVLGYKEQGLVEVQAKLGQMRRGGLHCG